ncbi:MAG: hypothetical protein IJO72_02600 [Oscillospiraceae bacterium]|nr:hypothetical protein [Oscillospiraceae bacterium]
MENKKVLVVGINPWIDNTGINTLINFFDGWGADAVAHIYTRDKLPNTHVCNNFFQISETKVVKSVIVRSLKTGKAVCNTPVETQQVQHAAYSKPAGAGKQLLRELIWKFGKWKTKELDAFLEEFAPDVLFFPVYSNVYMCRLQNYIANKLKKPVVLYSSDDNYSYTAVRHTPLPLLHRFWLRHQEKKLFKRASKVLVISPRQKEEYDQLFGIDCGVLTKGIDFSQVEYQSKPVGDPIRMVYTGKLIIGRWKSLAKIAQALGEINREKTKMVLDIYTTDTLTEEQEVALNRNGCTVRGALALDQVQQVQKEADVLVFVESLEKKFRYTARLSFSTKITDYLKSGKCIFAVGDSKIAPIDYFSRFDSAITATTYEQIGEKLTMLAEDASLIEAYSRKAFACGKQNHDKQKMQKKLHDTIMEA